MIITTVLTVVALTGQGTAPVAVRKWPEAMGVSKISAHSEFVRRVQNTMEHPPAPVLRVSHEPHGQPGKLPKQSGNAASSVAPTFLGIGPAEEGNVEHAEAYGRHLFMEEQQAMYLMAQGKLTAARKLLEADFLIEPTELFAVPLPDVELSQGDYISAYKVAAPFVRTGMATESILIRASLAAASLGEVYGGQRAGSRWLAAA